MKLAILIFLILTIFFGAVSVTGAKEEQGQAMPIGFLFPAFLSAVCGVISILLALAKAPL